jgi:hypothetical protein
MRSDVRAALAKLDRPKPYLYARYSSSIRQLADAENVLFYNVGTAHFSGLAQEQAVFERDFETHSDFAHEHVYTTTEPASMAWSLLPPVCEWLLPYIADSDSSRLAGRLCLAIKRSALVGYEGRSLGKPLYALNVRIEGTPSVNLLGKMKPLLDGVISGMHGYVGNSAVEVSTRLSQMLGESASDVEATLALPGPLGPRELVRPYRGRIQWNPADDACVHAAMALVRGLGTPSIRVALHPVEPVASR